MNLEYTNLLDETRIQDTGTYVFFTNKCIICSKKNSDRIVVKIKYKYNSLAIVSGAFTFVNLI